MRYEWLLLWEAESCYCIDLCVGIATVSGALNLNEDSFSLVPPLVG